MRSAIRIALLAAWLLLLAACSGAPSARRRLSRVSTPRNSIRATVALMAAQLCVWLRTPIPWMLGPLLITALASVLGAPTRSAPLLRNTGQWVIGVVLGLVSLIAVVWIKLVMRKPLFTPVPLDEVLARK